MKRNWFARHPIGFMALYFLLYLSAFNFLETQISMPRVLLVHCRLDDLIPFCKYAILPYFAWFAWIPFTLFYLLWNAPPGNRRAVTHKAKGRQRTENVRCRPLL